MAIVKERGTITFMSEVQSGTSQNGNPWYRQTIVVDVAGYNGSYRKVALQATGNVVGDLEGAMIGDKVDVSYQVTAREWQGKWYNNVDLYKVEFLENAQTQMLQPVAPAYPQNPQYPQGNIQQFVQNGMYPAQPAPQVSRAASAYDVCESFCREANCDYKLGTHGEACKRAMMAGQYNPAPAAQTQPRQRGRVQTTPQIPANTPMNLQDGDLPPEIFQ